MRNVAVLTLAAALVCGCGGAREATTGGSGGAGGDGTGGAPMAYDGPPIPWAYAPFPEVVAPADNPETAATIKLGSLLFYDPILASDSQVACSTCHSEDWGMGDGLPLSVGVDGTGPVGPGRTGPNLTTRNAMTLWNAAFRTELFYDGRAASLELQALQPMEHSNEMNQPAPAGAARIAKVEGYRTMFAAAFPDASEPITGANVTRALSAFERTFITKHAPYDQYVAGDAGAMSPEEKRGMERFGESGCAGCHVPPLFESTHYDKRIPTDDPGRFAVTNDPKDRGAFRVVTLRNLRDTGPYFHDGSVVDLDQAVKGELDREVAAGHAKPLSNVDFADLMAFLHSSLEDVSQDPTRPMSVPSGLQVPIDGDHIAR